MPNKPKHPCNHPGCPNLTDSRFCPAHTKQAQADNDARRPSVAARGYCSSRWFKLRRMVLNDNPFCVMCGSLATDVDHVDGNRKNDAGENLQSLCHSCHSKKTARENNTWGR